MQHAQKLSTHDLVLPQNGHEHRLVTHFHDVQGELQKVKGDVSTIIATAMTETQQAMIELARACPGSEIEADYSQELTIIAEEKRTVYTIRRNARFSKDRGNGW